jgi:hypothetical protein
VNYIITQSAFFFDRFLTATHICKTLNVMDKKQRILIFSGVFGDSYLYKTAGITKTILDKVQEDLYANTFEEGVESTPFEEHVAVQQSGYMSRHLGPMEMPHGMTITREEMEDNL